MLDVAQKYSDILKLKFANVLYDERYKFINRGWDSEYQPSKSTWETHEFVSLSKEGEVLGYIVYDIDRNTYNAHGLLAVNFSDNKFTYGLDLKRVIKNIFCKFNFNKLSFIVFCGNPIEKSYDKMVTKYGGRIVGIRKQDVKLSDGEYYDTKMYEILREDFINKMNNK